MDNISILPPNNPEDNLDHAFKGMFNNKQVTTVKKRQYIKLSDDQPSILPPQTSKKTLSNRRVRLVKGYVSKAIRNKKIAKTTGHKKTNSTKNQLAEINKQLSKIYTKCIKSKDNLKINKLLDQFSQAVDTTYSEHNLPTESQKKVLYNAYLKMSAHYLAVESVGKLSDNNLDIKLNTKELYDLIDCSIETDRFLKNNMNDTAYISAQMQQLVAKSCITPEKNEFVYETCLSIYNKPEPQLELIKAEKKRSDLLDRDDLLDKKEQLKAADSNIQGINLQLQRIEKNKLSTQKVFLSSVFKERKKIINNRLDKMITSYIDTVPKSDRDATVITSNIINMIKDDMPAKNNSLANDVIMKRVMLILQKDDEFEC
jgi:hypothetical protein